MGVRRVDVFNMDIVLYSTGDELVDLESTGSLGEGRIINSTRFVVVGSLEEDGISVTYGGILPDDEDVIRQRVSDGLKQFDSVILTGGGSSVGAPDATIRAIQSLSPEYLVHGTSIRPGRPNSVAVINGKPYSR